MVEKPSISDAPSNLAVLGRYILPNKTLTYLEKIQPEIKIHYRNTQLLSNFVNREGKIRPRRQTGTCAKHQRKIAVAVKRARHMALLQFSGESLN